MGAIFCFAGDRCFTEESALLLRLGDRRQSVQRGVSSFYLLFLYGSNGVIVPVKVPSRR